jgi:hypothetical protein
MSGWRQLCAVFCVLMFSQGGGAALAQGTGNAKPPEKKPIAENGKDGQNKIDEISEAARLIEGSAGNPECVWLGRRTVNLLWRDDLDTALRHLDLYDRFGCPGGHIQATFRCLVRQGNIDAKAQETLNRRVHACWLNPGLPPTPAAEADKAATTSAGTAQR